MIGKDHYTDSTPEVVEQWVETDVSLVPDVWAAHIMNGYRDQLVADAAAALADSIDRQFLNALRSASA